jgi:predicted dehydrogenase
MAVYNDLADDQRIRIYDKGVHPEREAALHSAPLTYRYGDIVAPYIQFREPLVIQAEHFIESIRSGNQPRSGGKAGLDVVRIIEAAELSLEMKQPVDISDGEPDRVISLPLLERVDLV